MDNLLNLIDCDIAGAKPKKLDFPTFVAGYLQEIITAIVSMKEFESVLKQIYEKIKHLSFLVHLMCRYEDFEKVYEDFVSVQQELAVGNTSWEDGQYFRNWEKQYLNKINIKEDAIKKEEDEKILSVLDHYEEDAMDSYHDDEDNQLQLVTNMDPVQIEIIKVEDHSTEKKKDKPPKKKGGVGYNCEDCSLHTTSKKLHLKHLFEYHEQKLCAQCGEFSEDFEQFWSHRSTVCRNENLFECEICHSKFKTKKPYENHQLELHGIPRPKDSKSRRTPTTEKKVCPECGDEVLHLPAHMKQKHSSEKQYSCQHCDKAFKCKQSMLSHVMHRHSGSISTCPHCHSKVKNLNYHLRTLQCYLKPEERNDQHYTCNLCGKVLKLKKGLQKHMREVHGEMKHCNYCDFKSKYAHNLKMHIKKVHENKPVKETCPHCNKECVSLEWHISTYHNFT